MKADNKVIATAASFFVTGFNLSLMIKSAKTDNISENKIAPIMSLIVSIVISPNIFILVFFGSITLSVIFQSDDDRVVHDLQQGWASALVLPGTFLTRENKTKWKRGKVIHGIF